MNSNESKKRGKLKSFFLVCQYGTVFLLLSASVLLAACASNAGTTANDPESPPVTVTINLNNNQTPLPTAPAINCGVWTTNTTPSFNPGGQIPIYAKFTRLVDLSPQGIAGATANITVNWADGYSESVAVQTTGDGLAVASVSIPNRSDIVNKNNEIIVTFTAPDGATCTADGVRAGYFTCVRASPTARPTPTRKARG